VCRTTIRTLVFLLFSGAVFAQSTIDIHLGVRGAINGGPPPVEVSNNHYFPDRYYPQYDAYAFGPTVGVLLDDRFEVRLEAVRSRFSFRRESGTPFPASGSKSVSQVEGRLWQYPLLAAYHFGGGPVKVFGGGGISVATKTSGTARTETTTVPPFPPFEPAVTTTSTSPYQFRSNPFALYVIGGFNQRVKFMSIRPEFRYARWTSYQNDSENSVLFSPNQFEFSVAVSIPLRVRHGSSR